MSLFGYLFGTTEAEQELHNLDEYLRKNHGEVYNRYKNACVSVRVAAMVDYLRSEVKTLAGIVEVLKANERIKRNAGAKDYRGPYKRVGDLPAVQAPNGRDLSKDDFANKGYPSWYPSVERSEAPSRKTASSDEGSEGTSPDGSSSKPGASSD